MKRILSLDGGGIRGIVTCCWLEELEKNIDGPLNEHFDLIAGTSTGAIIAAGISIGMKASEILNFYKTYGPKIFQKQPQITRSNFKLGILPGILTPRYDHKPLEDSLKQCYGITQKMGDNRDLDLMMVTYDVFSRRPIIIKSWDERFHHLPLWQSVKASCCAPSYFRAECLPFSNDTDAVMVCIDGGVVANNPSALALSELMSRDGGALDDILLVSMGTGSLTRPIQRDDAETMGGFEWIFPLIDVVFDATSDSVDMVCRGLVKRENYFRLQIELQGANDSFDDADDSNMVNLENLGRAYVTGQDYMFQQIARLIK